MQLSLLDLAIVGRGGSARDALEGSVALARAAEESGYVRVWYAEHHNMRAIASSAPAVLIAHVAAHTEAIRLGSGGVMLPNHSPLVVAEQFGMLATLHPGRIELGLGRAPGTDQTTWRAMHRDVGAAERFPQDVLELQAYLAGRSIVPDVEAVPAPEGPVPIYILGSSLFGAQLAAELGLPFAFASHFAPEMLQRAVALYRDRFRPSVDLERPHVLAAMNVVAADDEADARNQLHHVMRTRVALTLTRRSDLDDETADRLLASPQGQQVAGMMRYVAVGTPSQVADQVEAFARHADADEVIVAHASRTLEQRLRSLVLTAEACTSR